MARVPEVSSRGKAMPASPIRKLHSLCVAAQNEGVHVFHLNIGQPDIESPVELLRGYREFSDSVLPYGPSAGLPAYLKKLIIYYERWGIPLSERDILVTTGGSEAIILTLMAVADPGDEIIIPEPFYTNYNGFAMMAGLTVKPLTTRLEDNFALPPLDQLEALVGPRTRAIVLCSPGNPTGAVFTREELDGVADIARRRGVFVIADEVYREFVYDGKKHVSILDLPGMDEHAVMVDSISKRYSACGARIGCIVSRNSGFMNSILRFGQARLCPPTVDQIAAAAAVDTPPEYFERVIEEYDCRRRLLHQRLLGMGVDCKLPGGAFYMVARLPVADADHFAAWLLTDHRHEGTTVMIAPANGFYATPGLGQSEARLAYVLNCGDIDRAMDSLAAGLEAYGSTMGAHGR
ncbi:pyridoxal phosphate-dependent aminotransferase [Candidatus Fermentibacteria bacterium]|nr:pyridoxal phosphate-dependent aminotransferase [Candidatus Fermentibacteria bacterium]